MNASMGTLSLEERAAQGERLPGGIVETVAAGEWQPVLHCIVPRTVDVVTGKNGVANLIADSHCAERGCIVHVRQRGCTRRYGGIHEQYVAGAGPEALIRDAHIDVLHSGGSSGAEG